MVAGIGGEESQTEWVWLVWMSHCAWGVWRRVITFTEEAGEGLFLNSAHLFWSLLPIIVIKSLPRGNIWYLMWTCHTHFQSWYSFVLHFFLLLFCLFFSKCVPQESTWLDKNKSLSTIGAIHPVCSNKQVLTRWWAELINSRWDFDEIAHPFLVA